MGGCADDDQSEAKEPVGGHDRGEHEAEPEDCRTDEEKRDVGFLPSGREERAGDRSDRHD